jgi:Putative peptidoglycan binding domain
MGAYYQVQQGDCLSSIAWKCGFSDYQTIYLDSGNAAFREKRPNPNIIFPGDTLYIPDRETQEVACPTDQRHQFVLKLQKVYLRLCLLDDFHRPYKNKRYRLRVDSDHYQGRTDANGILEQRISAEASDGEITIFTVENDPADKGYTFTLSLGHLDPIDETSGVDARLINLGFGPPDQDGSELSDEERVEGIKAFQDRFGLEITGTADAATRQKLRQLHDAE